MATDRLKFRFMDLEIWRASMKVAQRLFDLAEGLEAKKLYQFAEQLRGAGLSMSKLLRDLAVAQSESSRIS